MLCDYGFNENERALIGGTLTPIFPLNGETFGQNLSHAPTISYSLRAEHGRIVHPACIQIDEKLFEDAGLSTKGNLSHRFRDIAVDFWLGQGCGLPEIAAMLGDTVAVVETHHADLASKRIGTACKGPGSDVVGALAMFMWRGRGQNPVAASLQQRPYLTSAF